MHLCICAFVHACVVRGCVRSAHECVHATSCKLRHVHMHMHMQPVISIIVESTNGHELGPLIGSYQTNKHSTPGMCANTNCILEMTLLHCAHAYKPCLMAACSHKLWLLCRHVCTNEGRHLRFCGRVSQWHSSCKCRLLSCRRHRRRMRREHHR